MRCKVKSGIFGQTAKFGQRPCSFHISIIGIKNKLTNQKVKILVRRQNSRKILKISSVAGVPDIFFRHQRISQRAIRTTFEMRGPRKHAATCDFQGRVVWSGTLHVPPLYTFYFSYGKFYCKNKRFSRKNLYVNDNYVPLTDLIIYGSSSISLCKTMDRVSR